MQKKYLAGVVFAAMLAPAAQAATVVGFKIGADYIHADADASVSDDKGNRQSFDYSTTGQSSLWFAVEHPLPFVPNLLVRENRFESNGFKSGADFTFNGTTFNGDVGVTTDLGNTDFVLYYELLDNDILSLDVGGAWKKMDGAVRVTNANATGLPFATQKDFSDGIMMGYASGVAGVPGLGLYGFIDLLAGIDEGQVYDYTIGLGWEFDGVAVDTRVRAGYREFNFDVKGFDGITTDSSFSGYFAGVELTF
ncbi:TIGR04219 family outer membrane beta-barrel protein [Shewanella sp. JM162201]|uniref:TIGR04219 family outer membrane beta-barrel protein n=1 Tax=Shewanella jiangmenensis TaxID=2837387 RepID=A0ABS5V072_9GAMM|nr:TIGR04219 family outer membrane beta-barrel protein [Shewanella jiangmenensis]MBT1443868.1 TIGR04219 family outer membrane beta-barrel protein [Shewanella jiangmenensis]